MKRLFILTAAFLLSAAMYAQERSSAGFGLDPSDAPALERMRARSDSIRQHRPVVALVLSGGGAKGAATVGALKFMERYDFPIDMVLGTSVGGLLGGFYALGYTPGELEEIIRDIDWDMALSDNVAPEKIPFRRREYKDRFALSFPFYYRKYDRIFINEEDGILDMSTVTEEDLARMLFHNLRSSLPSGTAFGQNVNQIISSKTVNYSDSTDFFSFPIPFACVSTDLVSGKAKVWHSGDINTALRATMSIPGIFAPVRSGNMVLVDGGMRNNFPVDIAKDMGADIVIGIDLKGDGDGGADTVHNIVDIVMSAIGMFSNDSFERSLASVDLMIKPQLQGFNLMSFDNTAIEFMLLRGWKAAESMAPQLDSLKRVIGHEGFRKVEKPAVNLAERAVLIDRVEVTGLEAADAAFVRRRLHVRDSSFVNARSLEDDIAGVYGEGVFDFINYELLGDEEPYRLRLHCQKGPVHQFGLGLRIDTEELVSALLNIGLNTNALRGLSADFTARIGSNPYLDARAAYIFKNLPTLNLGGKIRWTDRNSVVLGDNYYNISFFDSKEEIFLSGIEAGKWELLGGARNTYQHIVKILGTSVVGDYVQDAAGRNFQSLFAKLRQETLDDSYFPARGISAGVEADVVTNLFAGQQLPLFGVVSSYFRAPLTLGNFALVPKADLRFLIGNGIPLSYANVIGGEIPGRYIDQQIAFTGLNNAAFRRNCLTVGGVDLRQRFGTNHYVTLTGNFSYDFDRFSSVSAGELLWGAGLSYSYNTIAGPVKLLVHYNNYSSRVGVYFSAGLNF